MAAGAEEGADMLLQLTRECRSTLSRLYEVTATTDVGEEEGEEGQGKGKARPVADVATDFGALLQTQGREGRGVEGEGERGEETEGPAEARAALRQTRHADALLEVARLLAEAERQEDGDALVVQCCVEAAARLRDVGFGQRAGAAGEENILPGSAAAVRIDRVDGGLRRDARAMRAALQGRLSHVLRERIHCSHGQATVSGGSDSNREVWQALLGLRQPVAWDLLKTCVSEWWTMLLAPMLRTPSPAAAPTIATSTMRGNTVVTCTVSVPAAPASPSSVVQTPPLRIPARVLLEHLPTLLRFLVDHVASGEQQDALGTFLGQPPVALQRHCLIALRNSMPTDLRKLKSWQAGTHKLLDKFAAATPSCVKHGALEGDDCPRLRHFVDLASDHIADRKREVLLQHAADLIVSDYHNSVPLSGEEEEDEDYLASQLVEPESGGDGGETTKRAAGNDEPQGQQEQCRLATLAFEPCHVSETALRLTTLLRTALRDTEQECAAIHESKEAANLEPHARAIAVATFRACRGVVDLFRAVLPVQHADTLQTVPRIAALFYNDCVYMAHILLTVGHKMRRYLPPPLDSTATFVDLVPSLHLAGEKFLYDQVALQCDELKTTVQEMRLFDREGNEDARPPNDGGVSKEESTLTTASVSGVAIISRRMQQLTTAWHGILQQSVFSRAIGQLVNSVCGELLARIYQRADELSSSPSSNSSSAAGGTGVHVDCSVFSDQERHHLHRIMTALSQAAIAALAPTGTDRGGAGGAAADMNRTDKENAMAAAVPVWNRFNALSALMLNE